MLTFAMSLKIFLLVLKRSTKVSEKSDMAKSWTTFCCSGTYAHDAMGYSNSDIETIFDGEPDAYWNID